MIWWWGFRTKPMLSGFSRSSGNGWRNSVWKSTRKRRACWSSAGLRPWIGAGGERRNRRRSHSLDLSTSVEPDGEKANGGKAKADQADAAPPDARAAGTDRDVAAERLAGLLSIPRCA